MIILSLLALKLTLLHPFHVSVCDAVYDAEDKHLKISVRLFLDDLENALEPRVAVQNYDITDQIHWQNTQLQLEQYLSETLKIYVRNKELDINYLGSEIEADAMWCYLEVSNLKAFNNAIIQYTPFLELFRDQENLVHFRVDGVIKSCRLYGKKIQDTLVWN